MAENILVDVQDQVATITLSNGKVNVLSTAVQDELGRVVAALGADGGVASVVLTGARRAFAAGVDIAEMAAMTREQMDERVLVMHAVFTSLAELGKPVVAAVNGWALGGGCELALCADRRIASSTAVFGQPEIKLGICPGAGGTQRLTALVGPSRAKDLIFTGRQVGAQEALAMGLVDEVVEPEELLPRAQAWAAQFAGGPAVALAAAKQAVAAAVDDQVGLALEAGAFAALFSTEDRSIGMQHFLAKGQGPAGFVGR